MSHLRLYTTEDYPMVCEWWRAWKWQEIPQEALPQIGVIYEYEGKPICCAWLYQSDSTMCWIALFISNKDTKKHERIGSLDSVINAIAEIATLRGFKTMLVTVTRKTLVKTLKENCFSYEEQATNLYRSL